MEIDYSLLGERVATLRKDNGYSQGKLAELAGLSTNYLSNIENNHSIPSLETLLSLCVALGATPDALLMGIGEEHSSYMQSDLDALLLTCNAREKRVVSGVIKLLLSEREEE